MKAIYRMLNLAMILTGLLLPKMSVSWTGFICLKNSTIRSQHWVSKTLIPWSSNWSATLLIERTERLLLSLFLRMYDIHVLVSVFLANMYILDFCLMSVFKILRSDRAYSLMLSKPRFLKFSVASHSTFLSSPATVCLLISKQETSVKKEDNYCIYSFNKHLPSAEQWFISIDALNFGFDFLDGSAGSDIVNWRTILGSEWSISTAVMVQWWVDLLNKVWDVAEFGVISWVSINDGN